MLAQLLSIFLLGTFLLINVLVLVGRLFGGLAGMTWRKVLKLDIPENEKKGWEKLYTLTWLAVGLWAFVRLWGWSVTHVAAAIFGFLAFRSGANVTRTLIYGLHDRKLLEEHSAGSRLLGIVGKATRLSLLLESAFILSFALAYKALSVAIKPGGMGANSFVLYLWLAGLAFGLLFGWFIARNNRGILLRNELSTVGFFAVRKGKEKTDETLGKVRRTGKA